MTLAAAALGIGLGSPGAPGNLLETSIHGDVHDCLAPMMFIVGLQCSEQDQNRDLSDLRSSILVKEALTAMKCQMWLLVERKLSHVLRRPSYLWSTLCKYLSEGESYSPAVLGHIEPLTKWPTSADGHGPPVEIPPISSDFQSNEWIPTLNGSITNSFFYLLLPFLVFSMCLGDNHRFYELITNICQSFQHPALFWLESPQVQQTWGTRQDQSRCVAYIHSPEINEEGHFRMIAAWWFS